MTNGKFKTILGKIFVYIGLIVYAIWILAPMLIIFFTSFKTWQETQTVEFRLFPEGKWVFTGYKDVILWNIESLDGGIPTLVRGLLNTLMYVIPPTIIGLFVSALAAFAFAKLNYKGNNGLFGILLMTMLIPGTIMTAPTYIIYDKLDWINTPLPLMIPGMFGAAACVFFMKQFYSGIPTDLIEAAKLDGLGYFSIFWRIMVPLSVPALFAQGILGFIGGYNDYFGPLIYLHENDRITLQLALRSFSTFEWNNIPAVMAGAISAMIPTIIIYLVAQKYFVEGIATSGMKL